MHLQKLSSYTFLSSGTTRKVYQMPDGNVLKVCHCDEPWNTKEYRPENKREALIWLFVRDSAIAHLFLPVLDFSPDYEWIIVPFCRDLDYGELQKANPPFPAEWKDNMSFNWGYYEDRVVMRDYGALTLPQLKSSKLVRWLD